MMNVVSFVSTPSMVTRSPGIPRKVTGALESPAA